MKAFAIILALIVALIWAALTLLKVSLEGPNLRDGEKRLKQYYPATFESENCDDDDESDEPADYIVKVSAKHVVINNTTCKIGKIYTDGDLMGVAVKLKKCREGFKPRLRRTIVFSYNKNGGTLMHMFGHGQHNHLCSVSKVESKSN